MKFWNRLINFIKHRKISQISALSRGFNIPWNAALKFISFATLAIITSILRRIQTTKRGSMYLSFLSLPSLSLSPLLIVYITFADILKRLEPRLTTTLVHEDPSRGLKLVETARLPLCKDRMLLLWQIKP